MDPSPPTTKEPAKAPFDIRDVVTTASTDYKWLTTTRLIETFWDRHQRQDFNLHDLAELFHENTKMRRHMMLEVGLSAEVFMGEPNFIHATSRIAKTYPNCPRVPLSLENLELNVPLHEVLLARRSNRLFTGEAVSLHDVSKILYYSYGITGRSDFTEPKTKRPIAHMLRAIPSGGALYPAEVYLAALRVEGLPVGLYHYNVYEHALDELRTDPDFAERFVTLFPIHPGIVPLDRAAMVMVISAVFGRQAGKYGLRAYRFAHKESGHIVQNASLVALACRIDGVALEGFFDDELNEFMGLDGLSEAVIYAFAMGRARRQPVRPVTPANFRTMVK